MKTPITDKFFNSLPYEYEWADAVDNKYEMRAFSERLELDRAALMDMISKIIDYRDDDYVPNSIFEQAERTLIKVRANFPES